MKLLSVLLTVFSVLDCLPVPSPLDKDALQPIKIVLIDKVNLTAITNEEPALPDRIPAASGFSYFIIRHIQDTLDREFREDQNVVHAKDSPGSQPERPFPVQADSVAKATSAISELHLDNGAVRELVATEETRSSLIATKSTAATDENIATEPPSVTTTEFPDKIAQLVSTNDSAAQVNVSEQDVEEPGDLSPSAPLLEDATEISAVAKAIVMILDEDETVINDSGIASVSPDLVEPNHRPTLLFTPDSEPQTNPETTGSVEPVGKTGLVQTGIIPLDQLKEVSDEVTEAKTVELEQASDRPLQLGPTGEDSFSNPKVNEFLQTKKVKADELIDILQESSPSAKETPKSENREIPIVPNENIASQLEISQVPDEENSRRGPATILSFSSTLASEISELPEAESESSSDLIALSTAPTLRLLPKTESIEIVEIHRDDNTSDYSDESEEPIDTSNGDFGAKIKTSAVSPVIVEDYEEPSEELVAFREPQSEESTLPAFYDQDLRASRTIHGGGLLSRARGENNIASVSSSKHKFGYIVEGTGGRKYRLEEKTPEGYIVGEYGVVNYNSGDLRGVKYTAHGSAHPKLIYEALLKFLSL